MLGFQIDAYQKPIRIRLSPMSLRSGRGSFLMKVGEAIILLFLGQRGLLVDIDHSRVRSGLPGVPHRIFRTLAIARVDFGGQPCNIQPENVLCLVSPRCRFFEFAVLVFSLFLFIAVTQSYYSSRQNSGVRIQNSLRICSSSLLTSSRQRLNSETSRTQDLWRE